MRKAILLAGASLSAIAYCARVQAWEDWRAEAKRAFARGWSLKGDGIWTTSIALTAPPSGLWWTRDA